MVHNPLTIAIGDSEEMQKAISMLSEVKESIINAYAGKTGLSRAKLSHLMDAETWLSAHKAIELRFADGVIEDEKRQQPVETYAFSRRAVTNSLLDKVRPKLPGKPAGTSIESLYKRLNLLSHSSKMARP
jgi:ATP-dependent Clp protease protease subunit